MNTLDIHKLDDDRVRVTIKSEGERDQHVDMTVDELLRVVAAGTPSITLSGALPRKHRQTEHPAGPLIHSGYA
jgi:hypothetical protein